MGREGQLGVRELREKGRNVGGGPCFLSAFRSAAVAYKWVSFGLISLPHSPLVLLISAFSSPWKFGSHISITNISLSSRKGHLSSRAVSL